MRVEVADGLKVLVQVTQTIKGANATVWSSERKCFRRHNTARSVLAVSRNYATMAALLLDAIKRRSFSARS